LRQKNRSSGEAIPPLESLHRLSLVISVVQEIKMKLHITVAYFVLAVAVLFMIGACLPTTAEVVPLPSPTGREAAKPPATLTAIPLEPTSETSAGPCRFNSTGDLISGWYWLRDANSAAYGEWDCQGLAADQDVTINLQTLVTNQAGGGSGYSSPVKVTYTNPTSDQSQTVQVYLQNPLPEPGPADSHGAGYPTTGYLVVPRAYLGAGGGLRIRLERVSSHPYHVAVNAATVNFQRPHLADEFTPPKGSPISGWCWLRDSAHAAYGQWTFTGLAANTAALLTLDTLVTNGTNGGSGYSMPLAITLINPTTESQATLDAVQAQNLLFTQDSADSKGYGYQTSGSIMLDPGYIDANGNLIVRVARPADEEYHAAVNQNSVGIIQQGSMTASATPLPPTPMADRQSTTQPPGGKYLFVEFWNKVDGTGKLPALAIDFPFYRFDPQAGSLKPFGPATAFTLAPADLGFFGHGTSRLGAAGTGAASGLDAISNLPYAIEIALPTGSIKTASDSPQEDWRQAHLKLLAVSPDGTLRLEIDGKPVTLPAGEKWSRTTEADVNVDKYNGHLVVTSTLTNYGWQDRARLTGAP
jgi:hypothetical protein